MKINKKFDIVSTLSVGILIFSLSIKLGLIIADFIIEPQSDPLVNTYLYLIIKMIIAITSVTEISSIFVRLYYLLYKATEREI